MQPFQFNIIHYNREDEFSEYSLLATEHNKCADATKQHSVSLNTVEISNKYGNKLTQINNDSAVSTNHNCKTLQIISLKHRVFISLRSRSNGV